MDVERFAAKLDRSIATLQFYRDQPELLECLSRESQGLVVEIDGLARMLPAARYLKA
ncbi:MAG: hypothetical protein ABSD97_16010 [Acidimicrobiales bacterium]|jgi:hypothetical protein